MSLIVLNSKGSDPEDFSNFMTEQIKFPKDAEVCLVSSNINRKMMVDAEAQIAAGSNSIGIQLGHGILDALSLRDGTQYTPHSPFMVDIETKGKNFPIKVVATGVGGIVNEMFNSPERVPISNIASGWTSGLTANAFTFWNTPQIIDRATGSDGSEGNWTNVLGSSGITSVNNVTSLDGTITTAGLGAGFADWTKCRNVGENNNFADITPLWNTHNGGAIGTFTPSATNTGIDYGGYNWRFQIEGQIADDVKNLRGGLFDNTTFTKKNVNNVNSSDNKMTGGTAYTIWWELSRTNVATGVGSINFYARKPGSKRQRGTNTAFSSVDNPVLLWAQAIVPAGAGLVNVGIRPVIDVTGANPVYVMEAYFGVTAVAGNTWTTAPAAANGGGTTGKIKISDPQDVASWDATIGNFDLYRHLPLRMGCNTTGADGMYCNAIHHNTAFHSPMRNADLLTFSPFTFLLADLSPSQQGESALLGGSWDKECRQILRKSTLASVLGYNTHYGVVAASAMLPAGAGFPALIDLGLTRPQALALVVTLPDLPITGYYGNSSGDGAAGTLNMNSGGNSGTIVGVIPAGNRPFKDAESGIAGSSDRGEFFACPMENWICLNNPTPFSLSSIRCRITDALGNKPDCLDTTSTIVIKIKKRGRDEDYRQGGMNGVYDSYV